MNICTKRRVVNNKVVFFRFFFNADPVRSQSRKTAISRVRVVPNETLILDEKWGLRLQENDS